MKIKKRFPFIAIFLILIDLVLFAFIINSRFYNRPKETTSTPSVATASIIASTPTVVVKVVIKTPTV